jgi:hypothetical protein
LSIKELLTDLADTLPTTAAIDLDGWERTNRAWKAPTRHGDYWRALTDGGWFQYRVVGVTPGGTVVFHTVDWPGGTGLFEDLVFARIERDVVVEQGCPRERRILRRVGEFCLGDRDDGTFELRGNAVYISPSRYRGEPTVLKLD